MKKIGYLMTMTGVFMSLFMGCSEDKEELVPTNLKVEGSSISVEAEASTASFTVLSNKDWITETEEAWLTLSPSSGKADSKLNVEVTVSANTETTSRSGVIHIKAGDKTEEVNVEQKGKVIIPGIEIADPQFKQYLFENFDADKDGDISTSEAETVTKIVCSGKEIESLGGIEHFVNLDTLICSSNALTKIDLSKNLLLNVLDCSGNRIDSLGISENIRLEDINCSSNALTEADLAGLVNLKKLDCSSNQLTGLDISKNVSLKTLNSSDNTLTVLDVSNHTELVELICYGNQLTTLDVCKNLQLETLDCTKNEALEKVFLAKDQTIPNLLYDEETTTIEYPAPEIKIVEIPDENFKTYLVANFDTDADGEISEAEALNIKEIRCYQKEISSLEGIASCVNLELLSCYKNKLSSIDLSKNLQLTYLDCSSNELSEIDLSKNVLLENLLCYSCGLSALDLQSNVALVEVNCYGNNLRVLEVANNTLLQTLACQRNDLSILDLRKNQVINTLNCRENVNLTTVYLEENVVIPNLYMDTPPTLIVYPDYFSVQDKAFMEYLMTNFDRDGDGRLSQDEAKDVTEINCPKLGISSLDGIEHFTNLTTLICSGNDLMAIDVSSNKLLVTFKCDKNRLSRLDVSKNTALVALDCSENGLTSIDLQANKELTSLICNGNSLSSLEISNNLKLQTLHFQDNNVTFFAYLNENLLLKDVNCKNNPRLKVLYLEPDQTIETLLKDDVTEVWYVSDGQVPENVYIPDENFKSYLLENYDKNDNGEISLDEAKAVTSISCSSLGISSLSGIESFMNLRTLICDANNLTALSLSENKNLIEVNCYDNAISNIDVTGCTSLNKLICGSNELTSLNLTKNESLTYIDCSNNQITALNVRYNSSLNTLICTNNPSIIILLASGQYPAIQGNYTEDRASGDDVSFDDAAFESYMLALFDANKDGSISQTEAEAVTEIDCKNRGITSLVGLESFINLKEFDCSSNEITGKLEMKNSQLTHLNCDGNSITSIDVTACASLVWFMCSNNHIAPVLDLRANTTLGQLDCIGNGSLDNIILSTTVQGSIVIDKDSEATVSYVP